MTFKLPAEFLYPSSVEKFKRTIQTNLRSTLQGAEDINELFGNPAGDPGYFGPKSVTWKIHSDLPSMLVGGISSLLLQTLHPLAMAGVADHSNFREDPLGRLQRTALFVGTTTFAASDIADRSIETVKTIHQRVKGVAPTGQSYSANDPKLLTWVHVAETSCFLRAYRRFGPSYLSPRECDSYFNEMSVVARKLGATEIPTTYSQVLQYFRSIRSELGLTQQSVDGISYIINTSNSTGVEEGLRALIVQAAIGVLPRWARELGRIREPGELEGLAVDSAMRAVATLLRWALGESDVLEISRSRALSPLGTRAA